MTTKTFTSCDGFFTVTVTTEFFNNCAEYEKRDMWDLINQYDLIKYLHNETGPALIDHKSQQYEYFINGKTVSEEMIKEMQHTQKFNSKLEDLLNE